MKAERVGVLCICCLAFAILSVALYDQTQAADTAEWSISISDITVIGAPFFKGGTITVNVGLKSTSMISRRALLTVVAHDTESVPIGLTYGFIMVPAGSTIKSTGHTITIPSWAFVGTGTLYVNVFTDYPSAGGVPYCPERTTTFTILKR